MDTTTAVISACAALVGVWLGNHFAMRREHEADWRKMKLERYREYILALSGNVVERTTVAAQERYSDAANSLQLVAPPKVLQTLDTFLAFNSYRNPNENTQRHNQLLNDLVNAMRQDLQPAYRGQDIQFRLIGIPKLD
jgi:hypothetical protein